MKVSPWGHRGKEVLCNFIEYFFAFVTVGLLWLKNKKRDWEVTQPLRTLSPGIFRAWTSQWKIDFPQEQNLNIM